MQTTIEIKNLEIMATHGVLDSEKKTTQPFVFNATLFVNYLQAAKEAIDSNKLNQDVDLSVEYYAD